MRLKMVLCFVKIFLYCTIALRGTDSFLHPQRMLCWKLAQDAVRRACSPEWFWQVTRQTQDFGRDRVGLWNWEWRHLGRCAYCLEVSNFPVFFGQGKIAFFSLEIIQWPYLKLVLYKLMLILLETCHIISRYLSSLSRSHLSTG